MVFQARVLGFLFLQSGSGIGVAEMESDPETKTLFGNSQVHSISHSLPIAPATKKRV